MKTRKIILVVFLAVVGLQFSNAQRLDVRDRVEYSENSNVDDLNSITVSAKKMVKKGEREEEITIKDLERIVNKRRVKRYRKVRTIEQKCFKDKEDETCEKAEV